MPAYGTLISTGAIIEKTREASRLHSKSQFGQMLPNNHLFLNGIEAAYLQIEKKLIITDQQGNEISFQEFVSKVAATIPQFEIKYLLFYDLRKRGYPIIYDPNQPYHEFYYKPSKNQGYEQHISVFSEYDIFSISTAHTALIQIAGHKNKLWYSIVDEEGDITYYTLSFDRPQGTIATGDYVPSMALFIDNRILLFDEIICGVLHDNEFFGKPFGTGLQLSGIEGLYLMDRKLLKITTPQGKIVTKKQLQNSLKQRYPNLQLLSQVFQDLKDRGLIVKTGFKFGAHFRAYTHHPDTGHADYLIHVVPHDFRQQWFEMSRAIRLAHSVNKEVLFAYKAHDVIHYINIGRLRP